MEFDFLVINALIIVNKAKDNRSSEGFINGIFKAIR